MPKPAPAPLKVCSISPPDLTAASVPPIPAPLPADSRLRRNRLPEPPPKAAGAAITAAAAAGLYPSLQDAMAQLSQKQFIHYQPNMENHARYAPLYARYQQMRAFYAQKP